MQIDNFGFPAISEFFKRGQLQAHRIKAVEDMTYICFGDEPIRPIHRVAKEPDTGETVITWAFGAWENAETLEYIPINQTREI